MIYDYLMKYTNNININTNININRRFIYIVILIVISLIIAHLLKIYIFISKNNFDICIIIKTFFITS